MVMSFLRSVLGIESPVNARTFLRHGALLLVLQYVLEVLLVAVFAHAFWTPVESFNPFFRIQSIARTEAGRELALVLGVVRLVFVWPGLSLSMRRAADAGQNPWLGCWLLIPGVNLLLILYLCQAPSRPSPVRNSGDGGVWKHRLRVAVLGILGAALYAVLALGVSVSVFHSYGSILFLATPVVMGLVCGYVWNRSRPSSVSSSMGVMFASLMLAAGLLLVLALEGAVCLAMCIPPAFGAGAIGTVLGRAMALKGAPLSPHAWAFLACLPWLSAFDSKDNGLMLHEIMSSIEIDAPPEDVWPHVIGFSELPPTRDPVFRTGIAHPRRARIEGQGVGAVRYCEFSTGPFVEPITAWEPPRRLAFSVRSQPDAMEEWSPYRHIRPPHLEGAFQSRRGEFRLIALPGQRTRLEGRTWYTMALGPEAYWVTWADWLLHRIHMSVLEHVRSLAETSQLSKGRFTVPDSPFASHGKPLSHHPMDACARGAELSRGMSRRDAVAASGLLEASVCVRPLSRPESCGRRGHRPKHG